MEDYKKIVFISTSSQASGGEIFSVVKGFA